MKCSSQRPDHKIQRNWTQRNNKTNSSHPDGCLLILLYTLEIIVEISGQYWRNGAEVRRNGHPKATFPKNANDCYLEKIGKCTTMHCIPAKLLLEAFSSLSTKPFYRASTYTRYAEPCISYGRVVPPSVCPSVTRWHCVKTTQARITYLYWRIAQGLWSRR